MKKITYLILLSFLALSCEDVISLDVPESEPRLVIDASIKWFKGTDGNEQEIKLSLSSPYFDLEIPPATNAQVFVTNSNNTTFTFTEEEPGIYRTTNFAPEINETYNLMVVYNDDIYTASETLKSVPTIDFIEQTNDTGFTGEETEIKAFFIDPVDQENYYLFEFINPNTTFPTLEVYKDEFINGNQIFGFYSEENIESGNELIIRNYGVSERFYEFMFILLQQNSEDSGGPFETQPATVRGNCINQTNTDNFPFGYFRLSEVDEFIHIVE